MFDFFFCQLYGLTLTWIAVFLGLFTEEFSASVWPQQKQQASTGRQEVGILLAVCVSTHLYPQVMERCHLCWQHLHFNVPLCLHSTATLRAKHFITCTWTIDYNNIRNVYFIRGKPNSTLKHYFSSLQTQIKDFLHQWFWPSHPQYAVCSPCTWKHAPAPLLNQPQPRDQ